MENEALKVERIGFVGAGNMAEAIIRGLLKSGSVPADRIAACDVDPARRRYMADTHGIAVGSSGRELVRRCDVTVLAVKPQVVSEVLDEIGPHLGPEKLLISVVGGLTAGSIGRRVPEGTRIVRTMPNTPAIVGEGMIAIAVDPSMRSSDRKTVAGIFAPVGRTVSLPERLLDAVTGLSGSGPAYVFMIIEALADGGVLMGLPREAAQMLAAQTVLGASRLLLESGRHPGQLKDMVASPGGTTIAGIRELEAGGLRATLMNAVQAAARRSAELGRMAESGPSGASVKG